MDTYAIGIDISAEFFTASCITQTFDVVFFGLNFDQTPEGYEELLLSIETHGITDRLPVVMENTGVYSERISHFLHEQGIPVYVEPAHRIKKAFHEREKDDDIDSRQIGEYYFRYYDKLHPWSPPGEVTEALQTLLTIREQFTGIRGSLKNALKSLKLKQRRKEELEQRFSTRIGDFRQELKQLDQDLDTVLATNPKLKQKVDDIISIGSVGKLLSLNLLVVTNGFTDHIDPAELAKYIGIAPLKHKSGKSIKKRKKADGVGPTRIRKLLYLAAMRMRQTHPEYKKYYERKLAEGKPGRLILNNMSNKLLRLICGILRNGKPYIQEYRSQKPEGE